jgi:uncharacterized repeat protein (TIGR01451 family)
LVAQVISPVSVTNIATISHSDQFDPDTNNNTSSVRVSSQRADLTLNKTVSNPTPNVGDTITFTVDLADLGPDSATDVTVADLLPSGLRFVSASPSQGTYDSATGVWTVGTVSTSASQTLTIIAQVLSPASVANVASISQSDQFDPVTANNTSAATVSPQQADLAVSKTVDNATPRLGDTVNFTVKLTDTGPSNATGVQVTDLLPTGLTFISSNPTQGSYNPATGLWNVGAVADGADATLVVQARVVSPGTETNSATISHTDQFDPNAGNNTSSVVVSASSPTVTVVSLERFGFHHEPTLLVVRFSGPLEVSSAQDLTNYKLILIAHGGRLRRPLSIANATYNATDLTVLLHPRKRLPLRFHYVLTINASTPSGVRDTSGRLLDGDGNGIPGGNFVRFFGGNILAGKNLQFIRHKVVSTRPTLRHRLPALPANSSRLRA